jgi:hypothetical protein
LDVISTRPARRKGGRKIMEINPRDIVYAAFFLVMAALCAIDVWVI